MIENRRNVKKQAECAKVFQSAIVDESVPFKKQILRLEMFGEFTSIIEEMTRY